MLPYFSGCRTFTLDFMVPYLGEILLFAGNFAPQGWALCHGQLLPINQNQALFSILGTSYGGDGRTTFALPDLRGRAPIHFTGTTPYTLGNKLGEEAHPLTLNELPAHTHPAAVTVTTQVACSSLDGDSSSPAGNYPAVASNTPDLMYGSATGSTRMANGSVQFEVQPSVQFVGSNQPHDNRMPSLTIHYIIAINGAFPSQN